MIVRMVGIPGIESAQVLIDPNDFPLKEITIHVPVETFGEEGAAQAIYDRVINSLRKKEIIK